MNCCDSCDNLGLATGSSGSSGPPGPPGITTLFLGQQNIFVSKDGNDSTGIERDLTKSFLTIGAAITRASTLSPSPTNVINIIVYPGQYIENISVPQYVNIVSAIDSGELFNRAGYSSVSSNSQNALRPIYINGTVTVLSNNVKLIGFNCNILAINSSTTNGEYRSIIASVSITTDQSTVSGSFIDVHSLLFLSGNITISGYLEKCTSGANSFASGVGVNGGNISATMVDCISTSNSFSSTDTATAGTISGILIRCISTAGNSFSSSTTGTGGVISGSLYDCEGVVAFSSSTNNIAGSISGRLYRCIATSIGFSSGGAVGGNINGNLYNCVAILTTSSFSSGTNTAGNISGNIYDSHGGGGQCFSSSTSGTAGNISGVIINCIASAEAFSSGSIGGTISGRIIRCRYNGSGRAFSSGSTTAGVISGLIQDCTVAPGGTCFGGSPGTGNTSNGTIINCSTPSSASFLRKSVFTGKLINCRFESISALETGLIVGNNASITRCDIKGGSSSGSSIFSSSSVNAAISFCRTFGLGISSNVTNLIGTPYNIDDTNDIF